MNPRKVCETCKKPLVSQGGVYMHPETPCNGTLDYISITAEIQDEFLNERFNKIYGTPTHSDYERLALLETEITMLNTEITQLKRSPLHKLKENIKKIKNWFSHLNDASNSQDQSAKEQPQATKAAQHTSSSHQQ